MGYGRMLKPRIYANVLTSLRARGGTLASSVIVIRQGSVVTASGNSIYNLIAGRAAELTEFNTSGYPTTDIILAFDLQEATPIDFVAILNHNMLDVSNALVKVYAHSAAITTANISMLTPLSLNYEVGTRDETQLYITNNGSHVLSFTRPTPAKRYWAVVIEDFSSFGATNLRIGSIMIGRMWTAPYGADVDSYRLERAMDGVRVEEAPGGRRFGRGSWITGDEQQAHPHGVCFRVDGLTSARQRTAGRRGVKVKWSYMDDTELWPQDLSSGLPGSGLEDVLSLCGGSLLPVIWTPDSESTTAGDYMLARIMKVGAPTQRASRVWDQELVLEEEF